MKTYDYDWLTVETTDAGVSLKAGAEGWHDTVLPPDMARILALALVHAADEITGERTVLMRDDGGD